MRKITFAVIVCCTVAISFFNAIPVAYAETRIGDVSLYTDTVWNKEGSPYVLRGSVMIPRGITLTIEPGTLVQADLTISEDAFPELLVQGGTLSIRGSSGEGQVIIRDLGRISVIGGVVDIKNANIMGSGLSVKNSHVYIATSTISGGDPGFFIKESIVSIVDSRIEKNMQGIIIDIEGVPQLVDLHEHLDIGGIGNALETTESSSVTSIHITNSFISNNENYAIRNMGTSTVLAKGNWWGSVTGPQIQGKNKLAGIVDYDPWLQEEPNIIPVLERVCCSSVLFIPGLQASRLYLDSRGLFSTSTHTLWEPNQNTDVRKLFLDPKGVTMNTSIYPGGPIDSAFGLVGVYGSFFTFLDSLKAQGLIPEWRAFGYDWRTSIPEVVAGKGSLTGTTIQQSLLEAVESMALRSPTGKVTLIAHSNGGLVAKYLVSILAATSREHLIDSVISVAVPYLGTPEAILGLLHGDHQSMLGGLIVDAAHMRGLGENMASAYSLLPSKQFFAQVFSPTVVFASTTIGGLTNHSYPVQLDSAELQNSFITDIEHARLKASFADTTTPLTGNAELLATAGIVHGILDPFVWPSAILKFAIVGWNSLTTKGIEYGEKRLCLLKLVGSRCRSFITRVATTTYMGDGTVVVPSAAYNDGSVIAFDLKQLSTDEGSDIVHRNILEASSTQVVIGALLSTNSIEDMSLPKGVTHGEYPYAEDPSFLVLSTHSPVELHVYDSKGNHTGYIDKPVSLIHNDFITGSYENNIPGSSFRTFGNDGENDTFITVPYEKDATYSVAIKATDFGTFTFRIEAFKGSKSISKTEYISVPVTPYTEAASIVSHSSSEVLAPLNVDFDGDGSVDLKPVPGVEVDPYFSVEAVKKVIRSIFSSDIRGDKLIKRVDTLVDMVKKGKEIQVKKGAERLTWSLGHRKLKKVTADERQILISSIEQLFGL